MALWIESIERCDRKTSDQSPTSTSSPEALAHLFTHLSSSAASRPPVGPTVTTHSRADRGNMLDDVFKLLGK